MNPRCLLLCAIASTGCDGVFKLQEVHLEPDAAGPRTCRGTPFTEEHELPIANFSVQAARFDPERTNAYLSLCPQDGTDTNCDLYTSRFQRDTSTFGGLAKLAGVSSSTYDAYPTITPSFDYLIFSSRRNGSPIKLFIAAAVGNGFDMATPTELLIAPATSGNEPYLLPDGQTLYFHTSVTGNADIYRATGGPPTFGNAATIVGGINSTENEFAPVVSSDELEIFFASDRVTGTDLALDLYVSHRANAADDFDPPELVTELSSDATRDFPVWLSPDGCDLYLIHIDANIVGHLYLATR